ncbi:MAG: cyclase family protein [Bryobacteraceae bacterium]
MTLLRPITVVLSCAALLAGAPKLTQADVEGLLRSLSNWGRWGKADQLGALNLITPQKRKQAAALVREGRPVSLAHDVIKERADDSPPFEHTMLETGRAGSGGASDKIAVQYHGFTATHMDALCHMFWKGQMYNGYPQAEVTAKGAARLGVNRFRDGIFTRGVLIDLPRLAGRKYLEGTRAITPEDLDAWEKKFKTTVQPGDAVLFRTGRWARRAAEGPWPIMKNSAGLHASCLKWLKQRDVSVVGSDLATDVMPSQVEGIVLPVHLVLIVGMGVPILDNLDLEAAAVEAASRNRWEFLLTVSPLPVEGGTGSPVNPTAVF